MKFSGALRLVSIILLLGASFLAGAAWKNSDTDKDSSDTVLAEPEDPVRSVSIRNNLTENEKATIKLFEEATPSVCFISTTAVQVNYWTRTATEVPRGNGSGFVWDKNGHIITNYHVIQDAKRALVTLSDQTEWEATVVGEAPDKDLAVLKIDAPREKLRPIPLGTSEDLLVGQSVFAIGNPFGLDQTLTTGIVSALGREIESVSGLPIREVIQTDAAINPGNSGGPLLDSSGRLIGVNTQIYSPSGASAGIGFSIPCDIVRRVVPELIEFGEVRRPTLGISIVPAQYLRSSGITGVLVADVFEGEAADKAGIKPTYRDKFGRLVLGDIIQAINDEKVANREDLLLEIEKYQPGEEIILTIERQESITKIPLILQAPR